MGSKYKRLNGVCVVVPVYNEGASIYRNIEKILKRVKDLDVRARLIVVDDGSTDDTLRGLKIIDKRTCTLVRHKKNKGYGGAIVTGMREGYELGYKYALFMDSDLTNDPKDLVKFTREYSHDYDLVKASRYVEGGRVVGVSLLRRLISVAGNKLASKMFGMGISDVTNGFRMVKIDRVIDCDFNERSFSVIMEELYFLSKEKNISVKEVPYTLRARLGSKSSFNYNLDTFWNYIKYPMWSFFGL